MAGIGAYEQAHLDELSSRPNTTVYTPEFDNVHDPWKVKQLKVVLNRIAKRMQVLEAEGITDTIRARQECLKGDEGIRSFQRAHPKLFWAVSDPVAIKEPKFRAALASLIHVRTLVERGDVATGRDADALATRHVMSALQGAASSASAAAEAPVEVPTDAAPGAAGE